MTWCLIKHRDNFTFTLEFYFDGCKNVSEKLATVSLLQSSQYPDMSEAADWSSFTVFRRQVGLLDLLLTTFIFEKNCSQTCAADKACHSPQMVNKHRKLIGREREFTKLMQSNMSNVLLRSISYSKSVISILNLTGTVSTLMPTGTENKLIVVSCLGIC
jgi:hypothetical protein